jgi:hypothetical protein
MYRGLTPLAPQPAGFCCCGKVARRFKPDSVREKIRATQLINRLQAHIFDGLELSMSQVRAIEILLRKSVPDLTKTEVQADATHRYVAQLPEVLSREEWLAKYGEGQTSRLPSSPCEADFRGQADRPAYRRQDWRDPV